MINLDELDIPAILRVYMLANTPAYLYRHLRAEPSLERLAKSSTPRELLAAVSAREGKPSRTAEDAAIAYGMLVALSFQNYRDVQEALAGWQPRALTWARHITSIIGQTAVGTTLTRLNAPGGHVAAVSAQNNTPTTILELK